MDLNGSPLFPEEHISLPLLLAGRVSIRALQDVEEAQYNSPEKAGTLMRQQES